MTIVERYIIKSVIAAIILVTLLLLGVQAFLMFINDLDYIGRGNFHVLQAAICVLLQLPSQMCLFFPLASLLGSLIGLGMLANHRELVVMRASGVSIAQVTLSVLKAALMLIFVVTLLGETIIPKLAHWSTNKKLEAIYGEDALKTDNGVWLRTGNVFITIDKILPDNTLNEVHEFHFNDIHQMVLVRKIDKIKYRNQRWDAYHVSETSIEDDKTTARQIPHMIWDLPVKPSILKLSQDEPEEMTLHQIRQYLKIQKKNHQNPRNFQLAYWERLIKPLTTLVMMILAIPFIFGPLRSSTMGAKIVIGAVMGFSFHIINHSFGTLSQLLQWSAVFGAMMPTCLFALVGIYLIRRAR